MTVSGDLREIENDFNDFTPISSGMTVRTPDGVGRVVSNTYIDQDDGMESCMVAVSGEWNAKVYNTQDLEVVYVGMDRISGEPYADNETPCSADEVVGIIEEMRRNVFGTVEQMAKSAAYELGLEVVDKDDLEEYQHLHGWEDGQASQDYWQRVLHGQE